ncbi:Tex family protein [Alcaligenes endophyticus]|uniref:RNA-binding transcriptional accessory protein n=1 Tax=Alcaligenes endophyticus TaxID=1929088 RepID=A0ABT8EN91_9BURK|nr:Tex family protein [Alcaligenes endophyticus]MCX5591359.1 Tex family protein [Alcaligenes endophyticus]MDN4122760.1 RNA-binding transcriptional accessory protein [Alcaligenes endophyticus]
MNDTTVEKIALDQGQAQILSLLATELNIPMRQASAAVALLDDGATVPFIARYRKEATGGLDDNVLRELEVRLLYLRDMQTRRHVILESIREQGKLSAELEAAILAADTKQRLEDLYTPYKPKRRTRAQIAREAGLEPLADAILSQDNVDPLSLAQDYLNPEAKFDTPKAALDGARDILAERYAEDANILEKMRHYLWQHAHLHAKLAEGKEQEGDKFRDWFDFHEPISQLPSHRVLALLRGRQQGVLELRVGLEPETDVLVPHPCVVKSAELINNGADFSNNATARTQWLAEVCRWTWRVKLLTSFETEIIGQLREQAEQEATRVFAANLRDLLLAAPAGPKAVLGLDPGIRTGVKVAAIDRTGKVLETATIYPFEPRRDREGSLRVLAQLAKKHNIELVAIGNGTASRETEKLVADLQKAQPELPLTRVVVSEAGASVYSASELAAAEFPDLDVTLRGAVSIARRLQDPLAELVKIDPKAIGVGQYQHDVNQRELARSLDAVVEDCVNAVGVDVNTASAPLLARVSGLNNTLARNIVSWRDNNGAFGSRKELLKVPRFGEKAFEQAAGFLRIPGAKNPLDATAVHPEAYPIVEKILARIQADAAQVMGKPGALKNVSPSEFTDERFGLPTIIDIFNEFEKPGRDPRPEFTTAKFEEGINTLNDLSPGLILEGVVSNVANFGAFVDIGVHQDGLVHISALSDTYVKDPRDVVRVGQTVKVKVLEVDVARKRIALSMRLHDDAPSNARRTAPSTDNHKRAPRPSKSSTVPEGAMAAAFGKLRK